MGKYITDSNRISTNALYSPNEAYLKHGLFNWGKHKYIKRTGTPGNYTYTYAEDLKKIGRGISEGTKKLATNISTTARNTGAAIGRLTGITQAKAYKRAQAETDKWANATEKYGEHVRTTGSNKNRNFHSWNGHLSEISGNTTSSVDYAGKQLNRAVEVERQAKKRLEKTPIGFVQNAIPALKNMSEDVKYDVDHFLHSKVGVDHRKNIDLNRSLFASARQRLNDSVVGSQEWRSAGYEYDRAFDNYRYSIQAYGKTFLGSMENLLNTEYSRMMFTQPKGWGPKNKK